MGCFDPGGKNLPFQNSFLFCFQYNSIRLLEYSITTAGVFLKKIILNNAGLVANQLKIVHTQLSGRNLKVLRDHIGEFYLSFSKKKKNAEKKILNDASACSSIDHWDKHLMTVEISQQA